ncbi:MAG: tRNA threonylcarbamoyladenosine dehydratase [Eubacteriaceae bacterium]|nr:tRNA threonylcarbamoyladenosine dehydratase [Eubacteriaceae bacterium]
MDPFSRTSLLLGRDAIGKLSTKRVAVFGAGGVGGYAIEALARSGVGSIDIIDGDTVCISNINRQLVALHSTIGSYKADLYALRVLDINPGIHVCAHKFFFSLDTCMAFDFSSYDYVIDAIDSIEEKILLIKTCKDAGAPIISSMGAAGKLDPSAFKCVDIYSTKVCPMAKTVRQRLRKIGIESLKSVYSEEEVVRSPTAGMVEGCCCCTWTAQCGKSGDSANGRHPMGSSIFAPAGAGLLLAREVIGGLLG